MVTYAPSSNDIPPSDDECSFELIDANKASDKESEILAQSISELSLTDTVDSSQLMNFHVAEINRKNKEIDRLAQIIEEQKLEIEVEGKFGASHQGTSISKIDATGPAGMAGLKRGDQVISINGIDVDSLPQDEITKLSEECDDDVTLVVTYNPERLLDHVRF